MTVRELIVRLIEFDMDCPILIEDYVRHRFETIDKLRLIGLDESGSEIDFKDVPKGNMWYVKLILE